MTPNEDDQHQALGALNSMMDRLADQALVLAPALGPWMRMPTMAELMREWPPFGNKYPEMGVTLRCPPIADPPEGAD